MRWTLWLMIYMLLQHPLPVSAQELLLAANGTSHGRILMPLQPTRDERQAVAIVQQYFEKVTGVLLPVLATQATRNAVPEMNATAAVCADSFVISVGATAFAAPYSKGLTPEAFVVAGGKQVVVLTGCGKGIVYAAYAFAEQVLGCHKWSAAPALAPGRTMLTMPTDLLIREAPAFSYREVYFPAAMDEEYLHWHRLHRFEDLWGLWGHSFEKLVPAGVYFQQHPTYFAFTDGERKPVQLCLSNKKVLRIVIAALQQRMAKYPDAEYWSISPNDQAGYCECRKCKRADKKEGGPQGSLLHFVNAVAAHFPDKKFTMLAYGYSARPPLITKPAANVYIQLSNIDAGRTQPLAQDKGAAAFRNHLAGWKRITSRILLWDYCTQFTAYVAPFPSTTTFDANARWCQQQGVMGVFAQGSGDTYSDMADYKAYLLAALLWNPAIDTDSLTRVFMNGYYGKAAPYMQQYLQQLQQQVRGTTLDIYGNPVNAHAGFLSTQALDVYSSTMDKAWLVTEGSALYQQRVTIARLSQEYTVLQQARFYGIEPNGIFIKDAAGEWAMKQGMMQRVQLFVHDCKVAGVKELSEGGLTPDGYYNEWKQIQANGVRPTIALHAPVQLGFPFMPEYPAKESQTLTDGNPGYMDYSYNWLCFYNSPMVATIDLKEVKDVHGVTLHFLQDARHWLFTPSEVTCEMSNDGVHYTRYGISYFVKPEEDYTVTTYAASFPLPKNLIARYIKITAQQWPALPKWRSSKYKRPAIACDEIWVN